MHVKIIFTICLLAGVVSAEWADSDETYDYYMEPDYHGYEVNESEEEATPRALAKAPARAPVHDKYHEPATSHMSFYQKVKHDVHKFKVNIKHGKGKKGSFHGYAYPYAYGGLHVIHH